MVCGGGLADSLNLGGGGGELYKLRLPRRWRIEGGSLEMRIPP